MIRRTTLKGWAPNTDEQNLVRNEPLLRAASVSARSLIAFILALTIGLWSHPVLAQTSTIGDYVWVDADEDGIQDASEPGLDGVTIELYADDNEDGQPDSNEPVTSTVSDANGYYQLTDVAYDSYVLQFIPPPGYKFTSQDDGADIEDSDADPSTGLSESFTIGESMWVEILDISNDGSIWGEVTWDYHSPNSQGEYLMVDVTGDGLDSVEVKGGPDENIYYEPPYTDLHAPQKNNGGYHGISHLEFYFKYIDVTGLDAGFTKTTLIKGSVWFDYDGDGLADLGEDSEYSLDQWTVELYDDKGDVVGTTTVSDDGTYYFEDYDPGTYTVEIVPPEGYEGTYDPDGSGSENTSTLTLSSDDEHVTDYSFGYRGTSATGGYIWEDENLDGIYDPGESGYENWSLTVESDDGSFTTTLTTDSDGSYSFDYLAPGDYTVAVNPPPEYVQTYDPDGTGSENTYQLTLDPDETYMGSDFGYVAEAALPVKWIAFDAKLWGDDEVLLYWKTVEDEHTKAYYIQRSTDGSTWNEIGNRKALGQRSEEPSYEWIDDDPERGISYYRIKQTDIDGAFSYSEIRVVQRSHEDLSIRIYPNPVVSTLHIAIPDEMQGGDVVLYDRFGQEFERVEAGEQIDIRDMTEGLYMIIVRDVSGDIIAREKVLISR